MEIALFPLGDQSGISVRSVGDLASLTSRTKGLDPLAQGLFQRANS